MSKNLKISVENFEHKKYTFPTFDTKKFIKIRKYVKNDSFAMWRIHFA